MAIYITTQSFVDQNICMISIIHTLLLEGPCKVLTGKETKLICQEPFVRTTLECQAEKVLII